MSEHRRYLREEAVKQDVTQAVFGSNGALLTSKPQIFSEQSGIDYTQRVMCPFCLQPDRMQRFLVSMKKGLSQSRAQCPNCQNGMLMKTLLNSWTPEKYAEWVFSYRRSGFWQKIAFNLWTAKLKELGWSEAFWDRYKSLKGSDDSENYADRMNRQGEEMAAQWAQEQPGE